jgi:hypothetical protein
VITSPKTTMHCSIESSAVLMLRLLSRNTCLTDSRL